MSCMEGGVNGRRRPAPMSSVQGPSQSSYNNALRRSQNVQTAWPSSGPRRKAHERWWVGCHEHAGIEHHSVHGVVVVVVVVWPLVGV